MFADAVKLPLTKPTIGAGSESNKEVAPVMLREACRGAIEPGRPLRGLAFA
jgi:hypothetical protein